MTTNNNNRIPELRFPGFTGEWVVKKLGEIAEKVNSRNRDKSETRVLTNSATEGVVDQNDYFDRDIAVKENTDNYHIVEINDFVYNPRISSSAPVGPISRNKIGKGIMSPLYTVFRFKSEDINFLEHFFNTTIWHKYLKSVANYGARFDRMAISTEDFYSMPILLPTLAEQQKIAECLSSLDEEIAAEAQKADALKNHKKGLMQQLFPQPGQTTPQRRFPGFEGEWETPTISDIFEIRNGYTPSKRISEYWEGGTIPWFRMEDIRENGGILADAIQHITPLGVKGKGLFKKNSIILATTATIGIHAMLIADSLANQQFTNFSIRESLNYSYSPIYIYYAFFGIDEWCKKNTNAGGLLSVNMPALLKQPFPTPTLAEQQKIADCLSELDEMISAQQQKVEALKEHKKGLMQKLFPKM